MKKTAIILLSILVAGMFVACNQDVTVDAQVHANIELGTFVLDGKNYATLQEAVNAKLGKGMSKGLGDNDGIIYLTKNASGPGAVIDSLIDGGVTINFAGYTYSFTNVTGLQGGDDPKPETFGLAVTNGAQVTLKGLEQIDLFDTTTTDLTMVYVEGTGTSLAIEDAPKMKVEDDQYVFWAANGASLTIGGKDATESATVTGKVAATGTALQMPTVTVQGSTTITGAVEATTANIKMDDNAAVTGTIEVANTQVLVDGESKIEASLKATDSANVTINSKDNVITTLDKTANSTVTITESITVEEVAGTSEDKTIVIAGDGSSIEVVDETGEQQTDVVEDRTTQQDAVAVIGKVLYASLDDAVSAAKSGETIKILKDIEQGHGYVIEKDLSIDTNGKTITFPEDGATIVATNSRAFKITSGTLTVYGGGTIDAQGSGTSTANGKGYYGAFRAELGTELYLDNITIKNYRPWGLNVKILGATAELNDVTVISQYGGCIEVTDDEGAAGTVTGYAKLTECTMTQSNYYDWCSVAVSVSGNSAVDVYSTSYTGEHGIYVFSSGGTVNVYGGTFTATGTGDKGVIRTTYDGNYGNDSIVNVYGGVFNGALIIGTSGHEFLNVSGGTFDHDPSAYVVYGYKAVDNGDGTWTVKKAEVVAINERTEKQYYTVQKAIDEADSGDTLKLMANVSENFSLLTDNKTIYLDLNGFNEGDSVNLCTVKLGSESTMIITGSGIVWVDVKDSVVPAKSLKLRGGTYNVDLTDYVDDGFVIEEIEGPMWKVHAVASITKNGTTTYYSTLPGAVDAAESGDTVDLHVDVNLSSVLMIGKSLVLNGNDNVVRSTANRVVRITQSDIDVKFYNIGIISICEAGSDERGISIDNNLSNIKLLLDNCNVSSRFYTIKALKTNNLEVVIKNGTVSAGWAAIESYTNNSTWTIENSTLKGLNDKGESSWNNYATVVFDGDSLYKDEVGSYGSNNNITITGSTIYCDSTSSNKQQWINIQYGAQGNTVSVENTNLINSQSEDESENFLLMWYCNYSGGFQTYYVPTSTITIDGDTYRFSEGFASEELLNDWLNSSEDVHGVLKSPYVINESYYALYW